MTLPRNVGKFALSDCNWQCGLRTWTEPTPVDGAAQLELTTNQKLRTIADLWTDRWHLRLQEDERCVNFDFIVEFLGGETAMSNVPVLIETLNCKTLRKKSFAAYVDHFASWRSIAAVCGLDSANFDRKGNCGIIWVGNHVLMNDSPFLILPGMRITFEAPVDMERPDGEGPQGAKRARTVERSQPSSSSRAEPADDGRDLPDDGHEVGPDREVGSGTTVLEDPFAHLFHLYTDYARSRLVPAQGPHLGRLAFQRRARVAEIWGMPVDQIMGLHPVRARPYDIPADEEILIT